MAPTIFADSPTESFPYRVEGQAGAGAMGVVYRAIDVALERPVAIKVMRADETGAELSREDRRRFLQEARAAALLSHPGVTTVHRIGEVGNAPYIVMEWLEGRNLHQLMQEDGPQPLDRSGRFAVELLDVLRVAHASGVVHRDIKPSNLVIVEGDRLKVTDFGLAVPRGRELVKTLAGAVMATPQFASPEQLEGHRVDHRTDLFSAALVFYHLLTGAMPWEGRNLSELITAVLSRKPIPLRTRKPHLSGALDEWFDRALARQRDKRFDSAHVMGETLRRILEPSSGEISGMHATEPTQVMSAPVASFVALTARSPWEGILGLVRSWGAHKLGEGEREAFLDKLLDKPIHHPAFAGAAFYGNHCLLVEQSVVLAAIDLKTGQVEAGAELPPRADVKLFPAPADLPPGIMTLLASTLQDAPVRHQGLDSRVVHLPAFTNKLLAEGFEGVLRLYSEGKHALYMLLAGSPALAVLAGGWKEDPRVVGWQTWLGSVEATASFFDRCVRPPSFWFRKGFRNLDLNVTTRTEQEARSGSSIRLSSILKSGDRSGESLLQTRFAANVYERVGPVAATSAPMHRFLDWMCGELPRLLVQQRRTPAWKYLGDWLPLVRRVRLYADLERPGSGQTDPFDLVSEDEDGKVLHLAHRLDRVEPDDLVAFIERVKTAKEARIKSGDIGGVFLVSPSFSEPVLEAYRSLLHQGFSNRLLGIDKSVGYEGFVRMTSRRGFHFLLVEESNDGFSPYFVD